MSGMLQPNIINLKGGKKMNKKSLFITLGTIVLFAALVLALNQKILVQEFPVDICFDYDHGVNETIRSSTVYQNSTDWGDLTDDCINSQNLTEYACSNKTTQSTGQNLTFQKWKVVCMNGCVNGTCAP